MELWARILFFCIIPYWPEISNYDHFTIPCIGNLLLVQSQPRICNCFKLQFVPHTGHLVPSPEAITVVSTSWAAETCSNWYSCPFCEDYYRKSYILVSTEWFTELIGLISISKVPSTYASSIFVDNWKILHGLLTHQFINNGTIFVWNFFTACLLLFSYDHVTTAYIAQSNVSEERYNKTTVANLLKFMAKDHTIWD